MNELNEQPLFGGSVNTVVRIGDTVRRPTGPWTPAIHALLRHLADVKFAYAPRVLGIDEQGREVLTFIDGEPARRPWAEVLRSDVGLVAIGSMLRELAEAVATFVPPPDAVWYCGQVQATAFSSMRHGDLGPWNTIWDGERLVGLIDWDFAEPGPPLWDLAQAAWYAVPLRDDVTGWQASGFSSQPDLRHRLAVLCDAYGADPPDVLDALVDLQAFERDRTATLGAEGIQPWADFLARGDLTELDMEAAWLAANRRLLLK